VAFAESNRVGLVFKPETVWGEAPASAAYNALRYTSESVNRDKQTARSEAIRSDRMTDELAVLGFNVNGDINFEFSTTTFDTLLAAALSSTFTARTLSALTLAVDGALDTVTRATGSWITDGIIPGQWISFTGFTTPSNNAAFLVKTVTATVLSLVDPTGTLVTEASAAGRNAVADSVLNGVLKPSFVFEKQFTDLGKFMYFNGARINDMELDFTAMQVIKGKLGVLAKDLQLSNSTGATTVSSSVIAAPSTPIVTASAHLGAVSKGFTPVTTGLKSIKLNTSNNIAKDDIIGSQAAGGLGYGSFEVKGTVEAYFEDLTLMTDMLSDNVVSLAWKTTDAQGKTYGYYIPAAKFTKGTPVAGGINQRITIPFDFEAIRDANSNAMIVISRC
jgi:hypothetical protein